MFENIEELKKTDVWLMYENGRDYLRRTNVYSDTDLNYRMYNGNQWEGAKIEGIEKAQYNFIGTIVNYKVSSINQNLFAMHFASDNIENKEFRKTAKEICKMLDKKASQVWEKDQMDTKVRQVSEDAAINDEGVMYTWFDEETQSPVNEIINKNDIQFGNEQSSNIQEQPYILISQRKPIIEIKQMARLDGASDADIKLITGDNDTIDQPGDMAKYEKEDMCTLVTKMWKENGIVWFEKATKYVEVTKPKSTDLKLYPVAHFIWEEKKGWSRGEGEVRNLIPNQLELNKTLARMLLSVKQCAYAQKVVNIDRVSNPSALNTVGGVIKVSGGASVDDVSKIITTLKPTSMSTDVSKMINDLIGITRELKNASEIATGGIDPEDASGKAILAVQEASKQPLVKQSLGLKKFIEDIARIWLEMWTIYTPEGLNLEQTLTDENGEEYQELVRIPSETIQNLKGIVRIDVTPTTAYDKFAKEMSLENLLKGGYFNIQRLSELETYASILPDDSTMPKPELLEAIDRMKQEQQRIAEIDAQARMMQQRAAQFLNGDLESQTGQMQEAINQGQ